MSLILNLEKYKAKKSTFQVNELTFLKGAT